MRVSLPRRQFDKINQSVIFSVACLGPDIPLSFVLCIYFAVVGDRTEQERSLLGPDTSEDDQEAAEGHAKTNGGRKGDVVNRHSNRFDVTETTFSVPNSSDAESLGGAGEKHLTVAHAPSRDAHPNGNRRATKARRQSSPSVSFNPSHCFHTIVFDCSGWTFIDVMGMDTVRQVSSGCSQTLNQVFWVEAEPSPESLQQGALRLRRGT